MAIRLDIKDPNDKMILKFVGGLHHNLRHELVMFSLPSLQEAYRLASNIEARKKVSTIIQGKAKPKASFTPSTSNTSLRGKKRSTFDRSKKCGYCSKVGHEEVDYFKLHPEKAPELLEEALLAWQAHEVQVGLVLPHSNLNDLHLDLQQMNLQQEST